MQRRSGRAPARRNWHGGDKVPVTVPGSLTVTAFDKQSGARLTDFCASADSAYLFLTDTCTQDGTVTFQGFVRYQREGRARSRISPGADRAT